MKKISLQEFEDRVRRDAGIQCLDVREPAEYAESHDGRFRLQPLSDLSERSVSSLDRSKTTYLLCRSGNRACQAADRLEKMGFTDLQVIEGGLGSFESAGRPLVRGVSRVWSLERQVRFAAGALVLLGLALAWAAHPGAVLLSVFVACGLVFSAVTDTCGMALLLARMPWNRK